MKVDVKSAAFGFLFGVMVMFVGGADRQTDSEARWGLVLPSNNKVLVRDRGGLAFFVDTETGTAVRVEYNPTKTVASMTQLTLSSND